MENKFKRLNSAIAIVYTNDPKEVGLYDNRHCLLRKVLFNEPDIIDVKLKTNKNAKKTTKNNN